MNPLASLGLDSEIISTLIEQGYETPTPVQTAAIPKTFAGHNLLAATQASTGKTVAFMLPSLERPKCYATASTSPTIHPVRMLVLTPTRELADQIDQSVQSYIKNLPLRHTVLFGGVNMDKQTTNLRAGCKIIIATVGRLLNHVKQKNISLNKVEIVVLDGADRMLDMGFIDDIHKIMQVLSKQCQTLLFSATFAPPIRKLTEDFMNAPEVVEVTAQNTTSSNVEQHIIAVDALKKRNLLGRLIADSQMNRVIVFCRTKQSIDQVTRDLVRHNLAARSIRGDKSQQNRLETLNAFKEGSLHVLVAADVAAHGLDIAELPFVINYELSTQPEDYVHRIERTSRAGADGVAISPMDRTEQKMFETIKELTGNDSAIERIEDFEPQWRDGADTASSKESRPSESRHEHRRDNARKAGERNNRPYADKTDPDAACGKVAGCNRRSRRERQPYALLQPNCGA